MYFFCVLCLLILIFTFSCHLDIYPYERIRLAFIIVNQELFHDFLLQGATEGHAPSLEEHRAMFVDRGVGSPNFARPTKETFSASNFKFDSEAKVVHTLHITTKS